MTKGLTFLTTKRQLIKQTEFFSVKACVKVSKFPGFRWKILWNNTRRVQSENMDFILECFTYQLQECPDIELLKH